MKQRWTETELNEQWSPERDPRVQLAQSEDKKGLLFHKEKSGRLGLFVQLAFYLRYRRFPDQRSEIAPEVLAYLAEKNRLIVSTLNTYDWGGRTGRRHRKLLLGLLGVRPFDKAARTSFHTWLMVEVLPSEPRPDALEELVTGWFARADVERPESKRFERLIRGGRRAHEDSVFRHVHARLDGAVGRQLDALIADGDEGASFTRLRDDPGRVGIDSFLAEVEKLKTLRKLSLPADLLKPFHHDLVKRYRHRVASETPWELRQHPEHIRLPLLAFYCARREAEIVDGLVELLIQITLKMSRTAKRRVEKVFLAEAMRIRGKAGILYRIAEAASEKPDGVVREVIFPVAGEDVLTNIVKEYRATKDFKEELHTKMRGSYSSHYRRMLPKLLEVLDLKSNNTAHRPLLDAVDTIKSGRDEQKQYYKLADIAVKGVIKRKWKEIVIEEGPDGEERINRINYELCVLEGLRDRVRCKEIWVDGADRFRNPDDDLPADFAERRTSCFEKLELPLEANTFIESLQKEMTAGLERLNKGLDKETPTNKLVRISARRKKNPIIVTPLVEQPDPDNIAELKAEVARLWPMTNLLDVLKEADLRIRFSTIFSTVAGREIVDRDEVQRRLLLCVYGLGTNAGLKRLSSGTGVSYKELLDTRRKYLRTEVLRDATKMVANATLAVRLTEVWGQSTSCASDSTHVATCEQNLMAEWHIRYGKRGVMIYWHVEKKATCIHSQLKRCSSSEVSSMIDGVLHHKTDMKVRRQYVDSHGQSEIGFAFCRLLGFSLLPRLKAIARQRLYLPEAGAGSKYLNLTPVLSKLIDWELIRTQYEEMVRYATALREKTADAESILRRFTRSNVKHPTYRALAELGKAVKTIFLCEYLDSEALRREIHEGLNVIENWNGANDFVRFGRGGEMPANRHEGQETAMLTLHLLQQCLVYVNTLMIQRVLQAAEWRKRLTPLDLRALTPLIYAHVNPYGTFELNMDERMDIETKVAA